MDEAASVADASPRPLRLLVSSASGDSQSHLPSGAISADLRSKWVRAGGADVRAAAVVRNNQNLRKSL